MGFEWPTCRLEELAARTSGSIAIGPFGSRLKADCYVDKGVLVVRGTNLASGRTLSGEFVFITDEKALELGNANLQPGDLVFPHRGSIGEVGIVPADGQRYVLSTSLMKISLDQNRVMPEFLYYFFKSSAGRSELLRNASQVGTPGIATPLKSLRECKVPCPSRVLQHEAVDVLRSIDDRIDNLIAVNVSLEAIAQAMFKSWFVDFDPVRAKAEGREPEGMDVATAALFPSELEDSELGGVPLDWKVQSLGSVAGNLREQAKPELLDPDTPYVGLEHMPRKSIALMDRGGAEGLASGKFWYWPCDILFGRLRPYFHKVGVAAERGICSTDILVVRPHEPEWFGYCVGQFSSDALIAYATQVSNGARMPRVSWKDLAAYKVVMPPVEVTAAFDGLIRPMILRIHQNIEHARTLANVRDTLLPRLISGKLRLPDAEHDIEAATA